MPDLLLRSNRLPSLIGCSKLSFGFGATSPGLGLLAAASRVARAAGSRKTDRLIPAPPARRPGAPASRSPISPAPGTAPDENQGFGTGGIVVARRHVPHAPGPGSPVWCPACRHLASRCSVAWGSAPVFPPPCARSLPAPMASLAEENLLLIVAPTGRVFAVPEFFSRSPQGETCRKHHHGLQPLPSRSDH